MGEFTLITCPICNEPIHIRRDRFGPVEKSYRTIEGCFIQAGYSRGGWGSRQEWVNFSEEICGECFDELRRLLEPAVVFIRSGGGRKPDNVSPMRGDEPSPRGCASSVLRALPSFHRRSVANG